MVSAILLAAGESTRMGEINKLLLQIDNKKLLEHVLEMLLKSIIDEIIVVTGHDADIVAKLLNQYSKYRHLKIVRNENYRNGMTSSIQEGVIASDVNSNGYMVFLADMPRISSSEINYLVDCFNRELSNDPKTIQIPVYKGRRGNPVIFASYYKEEILKHKEPNGCRAIVKRHQTSTQEVEMKSKGIFVDIDTPEDYRSMVTMEKL